MLHPVARAAAAALTLAVGAFALPWNPPAPMAQNGEMSARDVKELGGLLNKALDPEVRKNLKDKDKAVGEVRKLLEKAGKGRNSKDPLAGGLAMTSELSKALHFAADYKLAGAKLGAVSSTTLNAKTDPVVYTLWTPKTYNVISEPFPLVLVLPGMKDGKAYAGEAFLQDHWQESALREKALIAVVTMPADPASWTENQTADGKAGGIASVMLTLRDLRTRYAVDFDRIYLVGRESGVAAAVSLAAKFPQVFAGVIGRSGDVGETPPDNFRALPTFFAGAGAQAATFEEKAKALGYDNCTLKSDGTDADAIAWMNAHPRQGNPAKLTLVPGRPIPVRAYWLRIPPTDTGSAQVKIEASIDRATNTVTVDGSGVRQVTLMFNDILVDLDKPLTVVLNGTRQEVVVPRNLDDTLEMMFESTSEPGRVYVARKTFDLPPTK